MTRGFYMHKNAVDVFIEVVKVQYRDAKRFKIKAIVWNLGYTGNPWILLPSFQKYEIKIEDAKNWIKFDPLNEYKTIRDRLKA